MPWCRPPPRVNSRNSLAAAARTCSPSSRTPLPGSAVDYLAGETQSKDDQALFFYLWCGPKSPFFGKHAMKTFERYFLIDKQTHSERSLFWKDNMQTSPSRRRCSRNSGSNG